MFKSLRYRLLIIFIGLTVVPLLLAATILTRQSAVYLERQSRDMLHEVSLNVGNKIRSFIDDHIHQLVLIHKLLEVERLSLSKQKAVLNNLLYHRQSYQDLALLDATGRELMRLSRSVVYLPEDLVGRRGRDEFEYPATHKVPYFNAIRFDPAIQEPLATISVPIFNLQVGALTHVLIGNLRIKKIWDLLANSQIQGGAMVYVLDQTGRVVAHRNPSIVLRGTTMHLPDAPGRTTGLSGHDSIVSWDTLQFGVQNLTVVAEQPTSVAFNLITQHLRAATAITFFFMALAVGSVVLAIRHFVNPIQSLATAARALSNGDYSQRVAVVREDEVGTLAGAFNTMSEDLKKYHDTMEELVKKRSNQLLDANQRLEEDIRHRQVLEKEREQLISELRISLEKVKTLSGYLPICASCKKIRDDQGYWKQVEAYISEHSEAEFSHGICPDCARKLYPKYRGRASGGRETSEDKT